MNCTANYNRTHDLPKGKIIILTTVHVSLTVATVFGSYLIIRAFCKFNSLRTAFNVILVSLSIADGLLAVPLVLDIIKFMALSESLRVLHISSFLSFFLLSVIILHLALISVERFIAVKFALRYHTIVTNRRALIASIVMWLWAAAIQFVFPLALKTSSSDDFQRLRQAINPFSRTREGPPDHDLCSLTRGFLSFLVISLLIIPLMIILCSYSYIFIVSRQHRQQIREQEDIPGMPSIKQEMKGARTLAIVVAVCLLSIVPLLVVTCLRFFGKVPECRHPKRRYIKFIVYDLATGLNATCNPLVYGWRNEEFRSAFRKLLKCSKREVIRPLQQDG